MHISLVLFAFFIQFGPTPSMSMIKEVVVAFFDVFRLHWYMLLSFCISFCENPSLCPMFALFYNDNNEKKKLTKKIFLQTKIKNCLKTIVNKKPIQYTFVRIVGCPLVENAFAE